MEPRAHRAITASADVELHDIAKRFGATEVLHGVTLRVDPGEFVCLLGPSGCGKTTLLRVLAGLAAPDRGRVLIRGRDVTRTPAHARCIGLVFQNYALFPHMTVRDNVAFGLDARGVRGGDAAVRIEKTLALLQLVGLERRYPRQLSGGQQQRVALARALVLEPDVLLLDEPLSNLDARLRQEVRDEIRAVQRALGITTVFVTHDQEEALTLADRIVVLRAGAIVQSGAPLDVYRAPRDLFVANFLGDANVVRGRVRRAGSGVVFVTERGLELPVGVGAPDGAAMLVVRPEAIVLDRDPGAVGGLAGSVESLMYRGPTIDLRVTLEGGERLRVLETLPGREDTHVAQRVRVRWDERDAIVLPAEASG
jgi:putative spermidine/putrescine transport system ATP-binding protein